MLGFDLPVALCLPEDELFGVGPDLFDLQRLTAGIVDPNFPGKPSVKCLNWLLDRLDGVNIFFADAFQHDYQQPHRSVESQLTDGQPTGFW